jgi:hypothetical protein
MRRSAILLICLVACAFAGIAVAQPSSGPSPQEVGERGRQPVIGPGIQHNIVSIEKMMRELHLLMHQGEFTPKQATAVSEMMIRLGAMMQEMSGPQGEQLAPKHERELGSTQLGLRVTLHLLQKCGGRLLVASQPGVGSNFTLEFPQ